MIYDYPTLIVDGFFKYPLDIRDFALQFKFTPSNTGTFSGVRTESLHITHTNFFRNVCNKILDCYSIPFIDYTAYMHFHLTGEEFGDSGWVHEDINGGDDPPSIASIIYLNLQNNGMNTGTSLYKLNNFNRGGDLVQDMKTSFIKKNNNEDLRQKNNTDYMLTAKIGNFFNRMIAYDMRTPHVGGSYFGNSLTTSRLTLLTFFTKIEIAGNYTPLRRADARTLL
jgi:hypothetical protein